MERWIGLLALGWISACVTPAPQQPAPVTGEQAPADASAGSTWTEVSEDGVLAIGALSDRQVQLIKEACGDDLNLIGEQESEIQVGIVRDLSGAKKSRPRFVIRYKCRK